MRCIAASFYSLYSSSTWLKPKDLCSIWSFLKKRRFFYVQNAQISNSCQSDGSRPISSSSKNLMVSADKMASSPSYCKTLAKAAVIHESSKDVISSNKMIAKFIRSGNLNSACQVFDEMPYKTIVSWNTMLSGYCKLGKLKDAFELFDKMPQRDLFSFNIMLACYLQNSELEKAHEFFNNAPMKNVISWNVMISGLCQVGRMCEAHRLFLMMPEKNAASWGAMISGYAQNGYLDVAFELFRRNPLKNVVSWTAMITGFMKQGKFEIARNWFDQVPVRNSVTWNAMISGYIENCRAEDGLKLFRTMISKGVMPNPSCFSSILLGCSELSSLELGQQIHQHICKSPLRFNTTVGTSLLSMYYKCGDLDMSRKVFDEMPNRDIVTWNAMISGYAHHGDGEEAVKLFNEMHMTGIKPNWITFVSILMACNHSGLVDLGTQYFNSLKDSDIEVKPEHYSCMVDLLGRAGKLSEAVRLIESMPFKPHSSIFGTLLGACRAHKNLQLAEVAAKKLLESQPSYSIGYVQLANIYAQMNRWDDVARIRQMMKDNNVTKTPGYSWIQLKNVVHEFRSGDNIHGLLDILTKLNELEKKMKLAGYEPNLDYALHDVTDEEKEFLLLHHSEKLAVAFGLINIPAVTPIRIFKNLRVCGDCHSAMKYISMTEGREIILRDTTRFHHFKQGNCSCGDYW